MKREDFKAFWPRPLVEDAQRDMERLFLTALTRTPELRAYALGLARAHKTTYADAMAQLLVGFAFLVTDMEESGLTLDPASDYHEQQAWPQ